MPTIKEVDTLFKDLGGLSNEKLFDVLISGGSSGFNALFGGGRYKGVFKNELVVDFWTSSISLTVGKQVFIALIVLNTENKYAGYGNTSDSDDGFSIRLFKD